MKNRFAPTGVPLPKPQRAPARSTKDVGMKVTRRGTMDHGGIYVALRSPGSTQELELNWYPPGSRFATRYRGGEEMDHLAFVVDDVERAFRELVRQGAKVAIDPAHAKGSEVYVKDPDGIWIELLS